MKRNYYFFLFTCLFCMAGAAAQSKTSVQENPFAFKSIESIMNNYKLDTVTPPNDKKTHLIQELRELKGGFTINSFIQYKLEEEGQKPENNPEDFKKAQQFFAKGNGKKWLDNAVVNIYRSHYNKKEIKTLVRFHRTAVGKKVAAETPFIIIQAAAAAEMIKGLTNGNSE